MFRNMRIDDKINTFHEKVLATIYNYSTSSFKVFLGELLII